MRRMLATTIDELRSIALDAGDAAGYFPALYARVTDRIRTAAADGRFEDPERMQEFAHAFAHWYVRPRTGQAALPGCWRAAFDVAGDDGLMIVQHLLLGINAHVNHDLPQVVVERAPASGDLTVLRADFNAVNDILAETIPSVLASLGAVSRWVNVVASRGGGRMFDFSLRVARTAPGTRPSGCNGPIPRIVRQRSRHSTVWFACSPISSPTPVLRLRGACRRPTGGGTRSANCHQETARQPRLSRCGSPRSPARRRTEGRQPGPVDASVGVAELGLEGVRLGLQRVAVVRGRMVDVRR